MKQDILATADGLELSVHRCKDGTIVFLRGRVDINSSPTFRERLLGALRPESPQAVIVDLTEVTYMESSGIATLIEGLKISLEQQKTLCLRGLQGGVLHLFRATGIYTLFENGCGRASSVEKVS